MTEKRFEQYLIPGDIRDKATGMVYQCRTGNDGRALCDILNNLHQYNQDLIKENKALQDLNNQELQEYEDKIKGTIRAYLETERTEISKNVLKQLYEAIQR